MSDKNGDLDRLKTTCINIQKKWDELLKANEAEPASIGGCLYRLAYRGDGYDLLEHYGINTPQDGSYPCKTFIADIAMLNSGSTLLKGSKKDISFIRKQIKGYSDPKNPNGILRLAQLKYKTAEDTIPLIIGLYHEHYNEQAEDSKAEELQIQILWYCVFANVLVSMFENIKVEGATKCINGDYVYKILYIYLYQNIIPWHMGISEVHLLDSLCFFFSTNKSLRDKEQLSEAKTNSLRAAILSKSEQYNASESIFQKIAKGHTSLLPYHTIIAQGLVDMEVSTKFMIRSFFIHQIL